MVEEDKPRKRPSVKLCIRSPRRFSSRGGVMDMVEGCVVEKYVDADCRVVADSIRSVSTTRSAFARFLMVSASSSSAVTQPLLTSVTTYMAENATSPSSEPRSRTTVLPTCSEVGMSERRVSEVTVTMSWRADSAERRAAIVLSVESSEWVWESEDVRRLRTKNSVKPAITAKPTASGFFADANESGKECRKTSPIKPPAEKDIIDFSKVEEEVGVEEGKRRRRDVGARDIINT